MPKVVEQHIIESERKKHPGYSLKRLKSIAYGAMNNMGLMHGNKETAKGAAVQAAHDLKVKRRY